jgi:hypothetical protein
MIATKDSTGLSKRVKKRIKKDANKKIIVVMDNLGRR